MKSTKADIRAVVFDWGGVLIDEPCGAIFRYCAQQLGIPQERLDETILNAKRNVQHQAQKGAITMEEFWRKIFQALKLPEKDLPKTKGLWYRGFKLCYKPKPEVFLLMQALKKNKYQVGFLSNLEEDNIQYFFELGYDKLFDTPVFSCREGARKPESKIYEILLQRLQRKAEEVVFIDDKQENVAGAQSVGMKGILFRSPEQVKEELKGLGVKID